MQKSVIKRFASFLLLCGLSSIMLAGCLGEDKPSPAPSGDPTPITTSTSVTGDIIEPTQTVEPAAKAEPVLSLAANGARDTELMQGWPLMFEVSLTHPNFMRDDVLAEPLTVGTDSKPWTGMVKLEVTDAAGNKQTWPLQLAGKPESVATLDALSFASAYWTLGVEQTAKLAAGSYVVNASFANGSDSIASVPVALTVSKAPAALSDEQKVSLAESRATQAAVEGNSAIAMSIVDDLLAKQPSNTTVLEFKGDLLAEAGKSKEAMEVYGQALKAFYAANPDSPEPPSVLAEKQHEMMDKLLTTP